MSPPCSVQPGGLYIPCLKVSQLTEQKHDVWSVLHPSSCDNSCQCIESQHGRFQVKIGKSNLAGRTAVHGNLWMANSLLSHTLSL